MEPRATTAPRRDLHTGRVPIHGGMTIQYWEGTVERSLHVWPTPVALLPAPRPRGRGEVWPLRPRTSLTGSASMVAGVWVYPRYSSNEGEEGGIHYACNDPAIVGNVPEGIKDSSPPTPG